MNDYLMRYAIPIGIIGCAAVFLHSLLEGNLTRALAAIIGMIAFFNTLSIMRIQKVVSLSAELFAVLGLTVEEKEQDLDNKEGE